MTSDFKYSWAIKQNNVKKINSLRDKICNRKSRIINNIIFMKRDNMNIVPEFIISQLKSYLYESYRLNKLTAIYRSVSNISPLVREEKYEHYKEQFFKSEYKIYEKSFYNLTGLNKLITHA